MTSFNSHPATYNNSLRIALKSAACPALLFAFALAGGCLQAPGDSGQEHDLSALTTCDPNAWVYMGSDSHACEGHLGESCGWTTTNQGQGYHCETMSWGAGCEPGGTTCPGSTTTSTGSTDAGTSSSTTCDPNAWVYMGNDSHACVGHVGESCGWTTSNYGQGYHCQTLSWGVGCAYAGPTCSDVTGDAGTASSTGTGTDAGTGSTSTTGYDQTILSDSPVAYWAMKSGGTSETDLTGHGHTGTYQGGTPVTSTLPNGDRVAKFNGSSQYMTVPSSAAFSIPTTGNLTFEAWISPSVLQFPHDDGVDGYVDWMGKCENYGPTCEWEARMYDTNTNESPNRPNRMSAYVFNPSAGLGSAADWQPNAGLIQAGQWYHVVGEYTTKSQPSNCANAGQYPGSIDIWVNGVRWSQASHAPTGCMSQYNVSPKANNSALNVGTMALDSWFAGAIGKVAIYNHLLTPTQITSHYKAMTGKSPTGSCSSTCTF